MAWNIPPRSIVFTGRHEQLLAVREHLRGPGPVVILALHGMGGVGKTSLAAEYAHRFAQDYDIAWWVNAEDAGLVDSQLANLGVAVGWVPQLSDVPSGVIEVFRRLRVKTRWLLIFDNVGTPDDIIQWLPQGPGQVLLTSRSPSWRHIATPVEVDVFDRSESIALLRRLAPTVGSAEADRISEEVGDLPLALAQAAGVLSETGMPASSYLHELKHHAASVLTEGKPPSYSASLAAAVHLSLGRLGAEDEAALQLIHLCSVLAPEPVPIELFNTPAAAQLPPLLGLATTSTMAFRRILGRVSRYGLAKVSGTGLQLHRLTIAVIADQLDNEQSAAVRAQAQHLLVAAAPGDSRDPANWPIWGKLLPHLLAADPASSDDPALRAMAWEGNWYLLDRGELSVGCRIAGHLYRCWRDRLGSDDSDTLHAAHNLASAYWRLGEHAAAEAICRETLNRRRTLYGEDDRDTLVSAVQYAWQLCELGRLKEGYVLNLETVHRLRRVRGPDSRLTLGATHNLAIMLGRLGKIDMAVSLDRDTYERRRRLLGEDHPHTLISMLTLSELLHKAGNTHEAMLLCDEALARARKILGVDHYTTQDLASIYGTLLHDSGRLEEARILQQDTLDSRMKVLGVTHPHTIETAGQLARTLRGLGKTREAQEIDARFTSHSNA